jgi:tetratricopeptide (TPR) repeat protein
LEIACSLGDRVAEAEVLHELGNLFSAQKRLEDAIEHFGRAADVFGATGDERAEALALGSRANALRKLGYLKEARADISRAFSLISDLNLPADPWILHYFRYEVETAAGDVLTAAEARAEAIRLYAAYRESGGAPQKGTGLLVEALVQAIENDTDPAALADELPPASVVPDDLHPFRATLEALLLGQPAGPDDPRIDFGDVVELRRLQAVLRERLGG